MKKAILLFSLISYFICSVTFSGCGLKDTSSQGSPSNPSSQLPIRENTTTCLVPTADNIDETHNDVASIDYSNVSEGYIMARYTGSCPKVKLQIVGEDSITYTYNLCGNEYEAFPLSSDDGKYKITIYENISGKSYLTCLSASVDVTITNEFGPYLYPNQYCSFTSEHEAVKLGAKLAEEASSDLEVVSNVYNYIIQNITYDYDKAESVQSGYTSDIDATLESGAGICLDYAAVMTSMLRSQNIPTRLEVGYVEEVYHAWISTYITDIGWVNGIVEFDGVNWKLMDPTFAAGNSEQSLRKFIGDGSHYHVKYIY